MAIAIKHNGAGPAAAAVPPVPFEHEELVVKRGERSGAHVVVAIHSTALGPALGGVRLWSYPTPDDAERDALRLAKGMTMKAAAAGLDLGGGKGVICEPAGGFAGQGERDAALLDFGDVVESLEGRYVTAEDVGIAPADMAVIAERTRHLAGLPRESGGSGDPSPFTAIGVEAAMRACARERFGHADLAGRRVVVVGLGHVGLPLAERLMASGCELVVSDVLPSKRAVAKRLGAGWVDAERALTSECDILAPCALGGAINERSVTELRCEIVCGSANNQLADEGLAKELAARGVLYAPDFIANAGGLINVYREIRGYGHGRALALTLGIEGTMGRVLTTAAERGITPLDAARELAAERLGRAAEAHEGETAAVRH
jgi:leucine dehydrogenase